MNILFSLWNLRICQLSNLFVHDAYSLFVSNVLHWCSGKIGLRKFNKQCHMKEAYVFLSPMCYKMKNLKSSSEMF